MDQRFTDSEKRFRALHSLTASPKRSLYVLGIQTLWNLCMRNRWVLKSDFIDELSQRLLNNPAIDSLSEPDQYLAEFMGDDGFDAPTSATDPAQTSRIAAGQIYRRMKETGWFDVMRESVSSRSEATLRVSEEAHHFASYIVKHEIFRRRDLSACMFPVYATLKQANEDYLAIKDDPRLSAIAKTEASDNMLHSLVLADEKAQILHERLSIASHAYKELFEKISLCKTPNELLGLMKDDFRKRQFDEITQPLRVSDGIDRYSGKIVAILDSWIADDYAVQLLSEAATRASGSSSSTLEAFDLSTLLYKMRWEYSVSIGEFWDYLQELESSATASISRKYLLVSDDNPSLETELVKILYQLSDDNETVARLAAEAAEGAFQCPLSLAVSSDSLAAPRTKSQVDPDCIVPSNPDTQIHDSEPGALIKNSLYFRVVEEVSCMVETAGAAVPNSELPLSSRDDRVYQMLAVLAANTDLARYRIPPIDDETRIANDGLSVPSLIFEPYDPTEGNEPA